LYRNSCSLAHGAPEKGAVRMVDCIAAIDLARPSPEHRIPLTEENEVQHRAT